MGSLASPGGHREAHQRFYSGAIERAGMGHRASTLTRPGSMAQGRGSSQRRGNWRKAGVSLVREMGGRAFHVKRTCSVIGTHAAACYVWGTANRTDAIHPFNSFCTYSLSINNVCSRHFSVHRGCCREQNGQSPWSHEASISMWEDKQ